MSDIADVIKLVNKETEREDLSEEIKQYLFCDLRHKLWKMDTFRIKEYSTPDGKRAIFEYDHDGVGKITLEAMDALMGMITDRPSGEWMWQLADNGWADHICSVCGYTKNTDIHVSLNWNYCPRCGARMKGADDED